jgi:hypothetical protein
LLFLSLSEIKLDLHDQERWRDLSSTDTESLHGLLRILY